MLASLKGKPIHELISNGIKKLGGGAAPPAAKGKDAGKKEEKKDEKKDVKKVEAKKVEEVKPVEEEDMGLGGGLFDF